MFDKCSNLVRGPKELPATTIGKTCYRNMFYGCTSLVYAPALPVTQFTDKNAGCYQRMFYGCSSLSSIKMFGKNWRSDVFISTEKDTNPYSGDKTYKWCDGVGDGVEIWLDASLENAANWDTTWGTVIPAGWTPHFGPETEP
jgi:hypothetical protein